MSAIKKVRGTKLEIEKAKKKELAESIEYLKQVEDLPHDQAQDFVVDNIKEEEKLEKKEKDAVKSILQASSGLNFTYRSRLANYAYTGLSMISWPLGWEGEAIATDGTDVKIYGRWFKSQQGVLVIVKNPKGEVFVRGIKTTNDPEYDVKAIDILVVQAENTLDSAKGLLLSDNKDTASTLKKSKSGIILKE